MFSYCSQWLGKYKKLMWNQYNMTEVLFVLSEGILVIIGRIRS